MQSSVKIGFYVAIIDVEDRAIVDAELLGELLWNIPEFLPGSTPGLREAEFGESEHTLAKRITAPERPG